VLDIGFKLKCIFNCEVQSLNKKSGERAQRIFYNKEHLNIVEREYLKK